MTLSMKLLKPKKEQGFEKVKDLVRGTITVNEINQLKDAYQHFSLTPDIEIVNIKEKLDGLENITVNFVYANQFVGEM